MTKEQCFYLGKVAKKFSFKGELLIYLDTDDISSCKELESVFVDFNNTLVPFFIEASSIHKNQFMRVKFEDVDNEEQANELLNKEVYLPLELLPELNDNQFYYHEIIGFEVVDKHHGSIGVIKNINDSSIQPLLEIEFNSKEILIPLQDAFIDRIDKLNKKFYVNTPNGLVDLYL